MAGCFVFNRTTKQVEKTHDKQVEEIGKHIKETTKGGRKHIMKNLKKKVQDEKEDEEEAMRMKQLSLKKMMNLKAKGEYLNTIQKIERHLDTR